MLKGKQDSIIKLNFNVNSEVWNNYSKTYLRINIHILLYRCKMYFKWFRFYLTNNLKNVELRKLFFQY